MRAAARAALSWVAQVLMSWLTSHCTRLRFLLHVVMLEVYIAAQQVLEGDSLF